jgi:hypothetical protein
MRIVKTYLEFLNEVMSQLDEQISKIWDSADKSKGRIKISFKDGETPLYMTVELTKGPYGTDHYKPVTLIETTSTELKAYVNKEITLQDIPNLSGNAFRISVERNAAPKIYTFMNLETATPAPATTPATT